MLVAAWQALPANDPRRARLAEPIAALAQLGQALVGRVGAQHARAILGRRTGQGGASRKWNDHDNMFRHMERLTAGREARHVRPRPRPARARLRRLARAVGRGQPLPAHLAADRLAVRRQGAEHPGRLHLEPMGLAGLVRRVAEARHEEMVRHQRQQLRRGGRVRPRGPRPAR